MKARLAADFAIAMSRQKFPDDIQGMSKHTLEWLVSLVGNGVSYGTHKYIPEERLNDDLGLPQGAGVYGYYMFTDDKSYILLTCRDGLAVWAGDDTKPVLVK